jgi:hypothetical protein
VDCRVKPGQDGWRIEGGSSVEARRCLVSVREPAESAEGFYAEGLARLESVVSLSEAPIREVPDVDQREPPPLRPESSALRA